MQEAKQKIRIPCRKATVNELREKIQNEFENFYLSQMSTSKDNIFSHSLEIELKKNIRDRMAVMIKNLSDEQRLGLLYRDNLLESAYRFCTDRRAAQPHMNIDRLLKDWMEYVSVRSFVFDGLIHSPEDNIT